MDKRSGLENALARAAQLAELVWQPAVGLTVNSRGFYQNAPETGSAKPVRGMPYSSVRVEDKFIGIDIRLTTFISSLENAHGVLYARDTSDPEDAAYHDKINNTYLYYGIVCSSFANYALALPMHRSTREFCNAPEFYPIPIQDAGGLELCDVPVTTRSEGYPSCGGVVTGGHVQLITGLERDDSGRVTAVAITEGYPPVVRRMQYTAGEFNATLRGNGGSYIVYRYRLLDSVPPPESVEPRRMGGLMCGYGCDANYRFGEAVSLYVKDACEVTVEQLCGVYKKVTSFIAEAGTVKKLFGFAPGLYRASSHNAQEYWQVIKPAEITEYTVRNGSVELRFNNGVYCQPSYLSLQTPDFISFEQRLLTDAEKADRAAVFTTGFTGECLLKLYSENGYGRTASPPLLIHV